MACALDQAAAAVKELVRHPLQRDAAVRTVVAIDINLLTLTHREQALALYLKTPAARVIQFVQPTQGNCVTHGLH